MADLVIGLYENYISFGVGNYEEESSCCSLLCVTSSASPGVSQRILDF